MGEQSVKTLERVKGLLACLSAAPVLALVLVVAGCGADLPITQTLQIVDVHTGWYDAGIVEADKNKLVPSISLKLKNISTDNVSRVQIRAIFHRVGEQESRGEHFVMAIDRNGLAVGATSGALVLRSNLGYTGTEPRLKMLDNREFVDFTVQIFGKRGSQDWTKMGEYPVDRKLLTE